MNTDAPERLSGEAYLTFSVADAEYAVALARVREIVEFVAPVPVPAGPRDILGVINLRGTIVAVADLAGKLGVRRAPDSKRTCIAMVDVEGWGSMPIGIIADTVNDIVELRGEDIEPSPPGASANRASLHGMGRAKRGGAVVLDLDRLLSRLEVLGLGTSMRPAAPSTQDR